MAEREFTITELKRAGDGGFIDTKVKFTWTNDARSAPRGSWRFGLQQRTVREDYPGVEQPVEQVLGPNYTDFQLNGCWDDRYNFQGYALQTMRAFEELVQRGSMCRFEFETVSITGLIKNASFDYKRASYIMYDFTVSPHYRTQPGLPTLTAGGRKGREAFKPVTEYRDAVSAIVDATSFTLATLPKVQLNSDLAATHTTLLRKLLGAANDLRDTIDQRLISKATSTYESLKRTANALSVIKGTAAEVLFSLAALKSDGQLAWDNANAALDFDVWRTQTTALCRKLALLAHKGNQELARRADPKAVALYHPYAGESLYSISQRFYGTPGQWQLIATRNGLTTMTLQGTETLIIPQRQ